MCKCHQQRSCSSAWVIAFNIVQVSIITNQEAGHNCCDCVWCIILSVFSAAGCIVILNEVFKDICKEIISFRKCLFKAELYQLVNQGSCKGSSLAIISYILGQRLKATVNVEKISIFSAAMSFMVESKIISKSPFVCWFHSCVIRCRE